MQTSLDSSLFFESVLLLVFCYFVRAVLFLCFPSYFCFFLSYLYFCFILPLKGIKENPRILFLFSRLFSFRCQKILVGDMMHFYGIYLEEIGTLSIWCRSTRCPVPAGGHVRSIPMYFDTVCSTIIIITPGTVTVQLLCCVRSQVCFRCAYLWAGVVDMQVCPHCCIWTMG